MHWVSGEKLLQRGEAGNGHVALLALVEAGDTLDGHVVRLGRTRGEDDVFRVGANQVGDVLQSESRMSQHGNAQATNTSGSTPCARPRQPSLPPIPTHE